MSRTSLEGLDKDMLRVLSCRVGVDELRPLLENLENEEISPIGQGITTTDLISLFYATAK